MSYTRQKFCRREITRPNYALQNATCYDPYILLSLRPHAWRVVMKFSKCFPVPTIAYWFMHIKRGYQKMSRPIRDKNLKRVTYIQERSCRFNCLSDIVYSYLIILNFIIIIIISAGLTHSGRFRASRIRRVRHDFQQVVGRPYTPIRYIPTLRLPVLSRHYRT